jgi:hypothetical protein
LIWEKRKGYTIHIILILLYRLALHTQNIDLPLAATPIQGEPFG